MEEITLTVPGEPVPKGRPRMTKTGAVYTPAKTHNAENHIRALYYRKYKSEQADPGRPLHLDVVFYIQIPKSRHDIEEGSLCTKHIDTDNLLKLVSDALNRMAYEDDSQVVRMTAEKRWSMTPRTEIRITAA